MCVAFSTALDTKQLLESAVFVSDFANLVAVEEDAKFGTQVNARARCIDITLQCYLCFWTSCPSVPTQEGQLRGAVVKAHPRLLDGALGTDGVSAHLC